MHAMKPNQSNLLTRTPQRKFHESVAVGAAVTDPPVFPQAVDTWRPFPLDALPPVIRQMAIEIARTMAVDPVMAALPMLSIAGACIGNTAWARMRDDYYAPANIWSAIVLRSGEKKSPVLRAIMRPIYDRQAEAATQYASTVSEYRKKIRQWNAMPKKQRGDEPIEPPSFPHLYLQDATTEAIAVRLVEQPRGLPLVMDELSAFFSGMDQYRARGGHDRESYLAFYDAGPAKMDRKSAIPPTIVIPRAFVAVTGMIQPGVLARVLKPAEFDSGMAARFLFASPPLIQGRWTEEGIPARVRDDWRDALYALLALPLPERPTSISLSPDATQIWARTHDRMEAARYAEADDRMRAARAKLIGVIPRLALIHEMMSAVPHDGTVRVIGTSAMRSAVEIAEWCVRETRRVYGLLVTGSREEQLLEMIEARGGTITPRELFEFSRAFRESNAATLCLEGLVRAGLGSWDWLPQSGRGRPSRVFRLNVGRGNQNMPSDSARGNFATASGQEAVNG